MATPILCEFDKAGAEWAVVAYEAGDQKMIDVVNGKESPHAITGQYISSAPIKLIKKEDKELGHLTDPNLLAEGRRDKIPELLDHDYFLPRNMTIRQAGKKSNHGLNYRLGYRSFALQNEMPEDDAKKIHTLYSTKAYPGLKNTYWPWTEQCLRDGRILINCYPFRRKIRFLDEWGHRLLNQAASFVPQSAIGDLVNRGMRLVYMDDDPLVEAFDLQAQVHDSIVGTYWMENWTDMAASCHKIANEHMCCEMRDSRTGEHKYVIKTDLKIGPNWGHMLGIIMTAPALITVPLNDDIDLLANNLEKAWEQVNEVKEAA